MEMRWKVMILIFVIIVITNTYLLFLWHVVLAGSIFWWHMVLADALREKHSIFGRYGIFSKESMIPLIFLLFLPAPEYLVGERSGGYPTDYFGFSMYAYTGPSLISLVLPIHLLPIAVIESPIKPKDFPVVPD